ncbi:hypothetical protein UT300007_01610 [Clostridium sp. CTA-7]
MDKVNKNLRIAGGLKLYTDIIVSIFLWGAIIILDNSQYSLRCLGVLLIFISLYQLFKVRFSTELLILFGTIAYINISVALGDLLQIGQVLGINTLDWQMAVRISEYNALGAKSILLLMSILNLCINRKYLREISPDACTPIKKKENNYIFFVGLFILLIFWLFGYETSIGSTYHSNTRTIYEYSIIIFIVVWFYSGNSKIKKYLLYSYATIYILQALIRGDRSSAFPMIIVLFIIQNYKIKIKTLIILAICGIFASNIISVYRVAFSISELKSLYLSKYGMASFLSDTVSQSYYTAITILNVHDIIPSTMGYFINFLGGIIMGGGFNNADVGAISYNYLLNKGGGFYFSWFYFWFGIFGVVIGSFFLGYLIRLFFRSRNNYIKLYKISLIAMSFRWYLYTPFVLFRSVLFIFTILLLICYMVERLTIKKYMNHS